MKVVQIGILAALVVCAGLLFTVYRGQQSAQPAETAAQTETAAPPAETAVEPLPPVTGTPVDPPAAAAPAPAVRKPSPAARKPAQPVEQARVSDPPAPIASPAPARASQPDPVVPAAAPEPAPAEQPATPAPEPPRVPHSVTIPAGTLITVRLAETLTSERQQTGDVFLATLDQPLVADGFAIAERGAKVKGTVAESQQSGRVRGLALISLQLTSLHTSDGQDVRIATERFTKQAEKTTGEDAKKVGIGAALGAAIGAIAGGGKGAAIGAGVGGAAGAGTVAATRGKPAELPVETRLTFRLAEPVTITERMQ